MFEDIEHIETMTHAEYNQVLFYLKHPDDYPGDYQEFVRKIPEFGGKAENHKGPPLITD